MLFVVLISLVLLNHLTFLGKLLGVFYIFRILAFVGFTRLSYSLVWNYTMGKYSLWGNWEDFGIYLNYFSFWISSI